MNGHQREPASAFATYWNGLSNADREVRHFHIDSIYSTTNRVCYHHRYTSARQFYRCTLPYTMLLFIPTTCFIAQLIWSHSREWCRQRHGRVVDGRQGTVAGWRAGHGGGMAGRARYLT